MNTEQILEHALRLNAKQKFSIVDALLKSLDEPDDALEEIWNTEAGKRLHAYRSGKLRGIPMEQIFADNQ